MFADSPNPHIPSQRHAQRGLLGLAALLLGLAVSGCAKSSEVEALAQRSTVQQRQLRDLQETTTEALQQLSQDQQARIEALEAELKTLQDTLQAEKAETDRALRVMQGRTAAFGQRADQLQEELTRLGGEQEQTQTQIARTLRRVETQSTQMAEFQTTERDERDKLRLQLVEVEKLLTTPVAGLPDKTVADRDWRQAFFALVSGQLDLAAERFTAFEQNHPKDERVPEAIFRKGQSWFLQRRYDLAVVPFFNLLDAHPQHPLSVEAKWRLARTLEETGELRSARDFYEELIRQKTPFAQDATRRVAFINRMLPSR